ncbi:hypothetical protein BC938DRAFT_476754 [Jimgerdemannia flammicorona]|uniref:Uncharacterized protein n=1 Tax=Jimgerdemannia flammicorona TaxID=994334 RepID=A0A433PEI5_9FUNG|nr:hypothetical protein BC938DRAFT_476754 [Jimgerdemannia flammicorona]
MYGVGGVNVRMDVYIEPAKHLTPFARCSQCINLSFQRPSVSCKRITTHLATTMEPSRRLFPIRYLDKATYDTGGDKMKAFPLRLRMSVREVRRNKIEQWRDFKTEVFGRDVEVRKAAERCSVAFMARIAIIEYAALAFRVNGVFKTFSDSVLLFLAKGQKENSLSLLRLNMVSAQIEYTCQLIR